MEREETFACVVLRTVSKGRTGVLIFDWLTVRGLWRLLNSCVVRRLPGGALSPGSSELWGEGWEIRQRGFFFELAHKTKSSCQQIIVFCPEETAESVCVFYVTCVRSGHVSAFWSRECVLVT